MGLCDKAKKQTNKKKISIKKEDQCFKKEMGGRGNHMLKYIKQFYRYSLNKNIL